MATNFQLLSNSSLSSDGEETENNGKLDFSYYEMNDSSLAINMADVFNDPISRIRVEKLLLYNNILEGIPHSICELTNLTLLDVSNNLIRTVPQSINNLVNLTYLYLRNNEIGDGDLPKDMTKLTKLRDLNLSGNRLKTMPPPLFHLTGLRNLFIGGNQLKEIPADIKLLRKLKILYLGGNQLTELPPEICKLQNLHALILAENRLRVLPDCICALKKLKCLQLHQNELTTLPNGLIFLNSLDELSLRGNPLVVRFIREMAFQPASLLELSARVIKIYGVPSDESCLPKSLLDYLREAQSCVNPRCRGVYFDTRVEHIKFVDFCGMYRIPLMQYLCSSRCRASSPAVEVPPDSSLDEESNKLRRVLLG